MNIDELRPDIVSQPELSGGYLFKFDRLDPGDTGFNCCAVKALSMHEPSEQPPTPTEQVTYLRDYFIHVNDVVVRTPGAWRDYLEHIPTIDFHILQMLIKNSDALFLSTFVTKARNGKLAWVRIFFFSLVLRTLFFFG